VLTLVLNFLFLGCKKGNIGLYSTRLCVYIVVSISFNPRGSVTVQQLALHPATLWLMAKLLGEKFKFTPANARKSRTMAK